MESLFASADNEQNRPLCSLDKEVSRQGNTTVTDKEIQASKWKASDEPLTKKDNKSGAKESTAQSNFSNYSIALKVASYNFSG